MSLENAAGKMGGAAPMVREVERERVGAEREFAGQVGESVGFDHAAIDAGESEEARIADELVEKYGKIGMTPRLGLAVAGEVARATGGSDALELEVWVRTLVCVLRKIVESAKPIMVGTCTQMAFGFRENNDDSMRALAVRSGVTVARVSALTAELRSAHQLAINSFNKSAAAAEIYKLTNKKSREKL